MSITLYFSFYEIGDFIEREFWDGIVRNKIIYDIYNYINIII